MLQTFAKNLGQWVEKTIATVRSGVGAAVATSEATSISPHAANAAEELFSRLADITSTVSIEVKQYGGKLNAIRDELDSIRPGDAPAVATVIEKLIVLSDQTQHGLARAELRLEGQMAELADTAHDAQSDPLNAAGPR